MAGIIVKPEVNATSFGESISRLTRSVKDNRAAFPEEPTWLPQTNTTLSAYEDEGALFLINLYALCKVNRNREAIAEALDYFDERLIARQFRECDRALLQLQVAKLASSVIVSILGITIRAQMLKGRAIFYKRAAQEITRRKGKKYARELLTKYQ